MRTFLFSCVLLTSTIVAAQQYDVVLEGGRVMDPETGFDGVRNVGISGGKISKIAKSPLQGQRVVHAAGLVVAPGFIDLHQHAQEIASQRVKAFDGVTTALEMEIGAADVAKFLKSERRSFFNQLRNNGKPSRSAFSRIWYSVARWRDSSEKWSGNRLGRIAWSKYRRCSNDCERRSMQERSA